ncbi:MAG: hypothetical protein EOO96_16330 [Pedobacter sp.]|nr:MAG: hypothetical protein EOO96_16330 [Pedobacter sp.]
MKHIVTISLVFFSLTHLAKAEQRVDGLRIITERYCNRLEVGNEDVVQDATQQNDNHSPFFLSYSELTLIGIQPTIKVETYKVRNHIVADLTIRQNAKNNSP